MINRDNLEAIYLPLIHQFGLGMATFSPLFAGILTGKFNDGNFPENF